MNKVTLIGNWVKDCELRFTPGEGTAVLTGTLAVQKRFKKESGPQADFIPIVIWGKQAENTANYCGGKGSKICIAGRIETRSYDAKDGTKRYVTEVVADEVEFLNKGEKKEENIEVPSDYFGGQDITPVDDGEDIPF